MMESVGTFVVVISFWLFHENTVGSYILLQDEGRRWPCLAQDSAP